MFRLREAGVYSDCLSRRRPAPPEVAWSGFVERGLSVRTLRTLRLPDLKTRGPNQSCPKPEHRSSRAPLESHPECARSAGLLGVGPSY